MPKIISSFQGEHRFLSNFHIGKVDFAGRDFFTAEAAFQTCKTTIPGEQAMIRFASTPAIAKKLGRKCTLRDDWEQIKVPAMENVLRAKFKNLRLREMLLNTGDAFLIEGNTFGDTFWGVCNGKGFNVLGLLLMRTRIEIHQEELIKNGNSKFNQSSG